LVRGSFSFDGFEIPIRCWPVERDEQDKDKNWHVVERSYGSFSRSIPLPFDPDPAKVEAKFDKGVLRIHLPKPAEVAQKQQKIEIKKG
jgi:HSP20 family protein